MKLKFIPISIGAVLAIFLLILTFLLGFDRRPSEAGAIRITAPKDGAVVTAGQTILVTITPSAGTTLQRASAWIIPDTSSNVPQVVVSPPFKVSVKIPDDHLGQATLKAVAIDQGRKRLETSVGLVIMPPVPLQAVKVLPEELFFSTSGESDNISVTGVFSDGAQRDVRTFKTIFESTNPKVATVSPHGRVTAVAPGVSTIKVKQGKFSATIPVRVAVFALRGDLDGDGDVDQDDLNILLSAKNTPSTGPGDPRDLNNDGRIDALDARILVNLCSRPSCATR